MLLIGFSLRVKKIKEKKKKDILLMRQARSNATKRDQVKRSFADAGNQRTTGYEW